MAKTKNRANREWILDLYTLGDQKWEGEGMSCFVQNLFALLTSGRFKWMITCIICQCIYIHCFMKCDMSTQWTIYGVGEAVLCSCLTPEAW